MYCGGGGGGREQGKEGGREEGRHGGCKYIFKQYQIKPVNIQHDLSVSSPWRLKKTQCMPKLESHLAMRYGPHPARRDG